MKFLSRLVYYQNFSYKGKGPLNEEKVICVFPVDFPPVYFWDIYFFPFQFQPLLLAILSLARFRCSMSMP